MANISIIRLLLERFFILTLKSANLIYNLYHIKQNKKNGKVWFIINFSKQNCSRNGKR